MHYCYPISLQRFSNLSNFLKLWKYSSTSFSENLGTKSMLLFWLKHFLKAYDMFLFDVFQMNQITFLPSNSEAILLTCNTIPWLWKFEKIYVKRQRPHYRPCIRKCRKYYQPFWQKLYYLNYDDHLQQKPSFTPGTLVLKDVNTIHLNRSCKESIANHYM